MSKRHTTLGTLANILNSNAPPQQPETSIEVNHKTQLTEPSSCSSECYNNYTILYTIIIIQRIERIDIDITE